MSRGWPYESARHSLAARGIRSRGLVYPSGRPDPRKIKHLTRIERSIKDLSHILTTRYISGRDISGLTSAWPIDEGANISSLGWVILSLDPEIILKDNDLIKVDYTSKFFKENPDIGDRICGKSFVPVSPGEPVEFKDEEEIISLGAIRVRPEAVKRIEIHYGDDIPDPITGNEEDPTPWEPGSEEHLQVIFKVVEASIPALYWDRTFVVGYDYKKHEPMEYRMKDVLG